jgi:Domain of unknown function (DUF4249)
MLIKRYSTILFFTTAALLFDSCQKTVHLDLNNAAPQIVIQGEVTNDPGPYTITINKSTGFYAENSFPPVSGAVVKISDDQGVTDSLTETSAGSYSTHTLQGISGHTYTLSVFTGNNNYRAASTMPAPVNLDSITFRRSTFDTKQINAIPNFQDPVGIKNFYQFIEYINGVQFTRNIFVSSDRLSDGKYSTLALRSDSSYFKIGDQLEIKMYCIDENVYNYFNELDQSSGTGAFNTTASPANPASNISNGAYGYFSAHTTQSKSAPVAVN